MKKFMKIGIIALLAPIIVACNTSVEDDGAETVDINSVYEFGTLGIVCNHPEFDWQVRSERANSFEEAANQVQAELLEDLDYLEAMIEDKLAISGPINRRTGNNAREAVDGVRDMILETDFTVEGFIDIDDLDEAAAEFMHGLLYFIPWQLEGLGHMAPMEEESYVDHFARVIRHIMDEDEETSDLAIYAYCQYTHPAVMAFFGIDSIDLAKEGHGRDDENNITTEILVPGEVAYIAIANFMNNNELDRDVLFPFYGEIQDFDHLIIDLRGNLGGYFVNFTENVMGALIDEPLAISYHEFFRDVPGTWVGVDMYIDAHYLSSNFGGEPEPVNEFFERHPMPFFNEDDKEDVDYVIHWDYYVQPMEDGFPFDGKIWLLVDEMSASASELAAIFSTSSGFATVVGRPTMGVMGAITVTPILPNTGIIFRIDVGYLTDPYGRSLEEFGVSLDHQVQGDMDILDYTLDLINE